MRTVINGDGQMVITAENPTEAYALRQWWYSFDKGGIEEDSGCVSVEELSYDEVQKAWGKPIL